MGQQKLLKHPWLQGLRDQTAACMGSPRSIPLIRQAAQQPFPALKSPFPRHALVTGTCGNMALRTHNMNNIPQTKARR